MRFMMLMIHDGYDEASPGVIASADHFAAMGKYNETLTKAGVLLAVDGLRPASTGARVTFSGGKPTVTDGPFSEAKEVIGGYWVIQVRSKAEALEWASRCPGLDNEVIEVRQVWEMADLPPELLQVAGYPPPA
jgi:hypothetical protein